ncbi:hypothetical protein [Micromonospora tulbaghiae]|uniref:hypothetical protein n=1 Tax=Micromonospora tulbaghiae TaxID=479978 RepID=UPI003420663E
MRTAASTARASTDTHQALRRGKSRMHLYDSAMVTLRRPDPGRVDDYVTTYAALALATFSEIAERSGFGGIVGIALRLDGTLGVTPVREVRSRLWDPSVPYPDEHYQRVTSATTVELRGDLTPVMDRLCGRFFRALGLGDSLRQRPAGS